MNFFLVSQSAMMRGVVTAINWLNPPKMGTTGAFPTVQEAITAAEKRLNKQLPVLLKLHDEVLSRAE